MENIKGDPLLAQAADDAVRQWRFAPLHQETAIIAGVNVLPLDFTASLSVKPPPYNPLTLYGSATIFATIARDGHVVDAFGLRGQGETIKAAIDTILRWKSSPALLHGVPQELCGTVEFLYNWRGGSLPRREKLLDVSPVYPPEARANRVKGQVMIEAAIGEEGQVQTLRVLRPNAYLDSAAVEAGKQWRFAPLFVNGEPFPSLETLVIIFP